MALSFYIVQDIIILYLQIIFILEIFIRKFGDKAFCRGVLHKVVTGCLRRDQHVTH